MYSCTMSQPICTGALCLNQYVQVHYVSTNMYRCIMSQPICTGALCLKQYVQVHYVSTNMYRCTMSQPICTGALCLNQYVQVHYVSTNMYRCTMSQPICTGALCLKPGLIVRLFSSVTRCVKSCAGLPEGVYGLCDDCSQFLMCSNRETVYTCPPNTFFNYYLQTCIFNYRC